TAGRSYAMFNSMWGAPEGYSYACMRDVSALVRAYVPENTAGHRPGNALYTVDGITASTGSNFSFAGWSLIIIYAAPETAGHYIYLRDNTFAFHPGTGGTLDFDEDPSYPGGVITNFVIPEPIRDKNGNIKYPVAAKLTCFIVEGDDFTNDTSSVRITGEQSGKSMNLWNPASPSPDVVNGRSYPGTFAEGVDIDTFEIKWSDKVDGVPVLTPGDRRLFVDMYSYNDAWNLVYFIISIQSETVTGGTTHYVITSE
ncbi:MAG: hypothetical protein N2506_04605, partial [Dehalococcoidales bacterium]|nr:hypothetical protein [Dehalococcoidales bacterium]